MLQAAAVLGASFLWDVLASVTGVPPGELAGALATGRDARLLEPAGPGEDRFRHELVRDAVYDAIPGADREELHAQAGGVLAAVAARGRDVDDAEVAYHLVRAGPAAAGQATEYARRAGDRAMAALAFEDAARWYQLVGQAGWPRPGARDADQARRRAGSLGAARLAATATRTAARPGSGRPPTRPAAPGAPTCSPGPPWAWAAAPAGFEVQLLDGEQISLLEEARFALTDEDGPCVGAQRRVGGHGALTALVTARLSIASSMIIPERGRLELAAEAVRRARDAGDDAALAACLAALCDAIAGPDHCAERRDRATEIIDIAARLREPVLGLLGRRLRLVALLEAGAIADWEADALAYQTAAEALRHPLYAWYVPLWRGMRALAAGRFGECREALAEAGDTGARAGSRNATLLVATQQWCLHAEQGDVAGLLTMLPQLDTAPMAGPMLQVTRALVLAQVGRAEEARAQFEAVTPLLPAMARDSEWLPVVAQVGETMALIGPHPVARWAYDALTPYAGLFVVEGICAAVRGPMPPAPSPAGRRARRPRGGSRAPGRGRDPGPGARRGRPDGPHRAGGPPVASRRRPASAGRRRRRAGPCLPPGGRGVDDRLWRPPGPVAGQQGPA